MERLGKRLAWILRHRPDAVGLVLDRHGWAEVDELLAGMAAHGRPCTRAELDRCVASDAKRRFTLSPDGRRIRAAQGHSVAVDLGLVAREPPAVLYHGTPARALASIRAAGLARGARHDVHLSADPATAAVVGERRGAAIVLEIAAGRMHADGFEFRQSDNGVWLTERVPPAYLAPLASPDDSRNESPVAEALELALPDVRLAALAWGPADGAPVLALHGWLDNAASFTELAPRICAALGLRVVALDLPGHGLSEHKRGPYHFIDSVADAVQAADALGWDRFSLLGHSMGAGISTLVAGTVPERIDRVVLLEGLGPMVTDPAHAPRQLSRSIRSESRKREAPERRYPDRESVVARLCEAIKIAPASAEILIDRGLAQQPDGWAWRADPRLRVESRLRLSEDQVHGFLRAITAPVLLVSATEGWPHDPATYERRGEAVARLTHVTLPGHHHVHLDDPEPVAAAIVEFLTSSEP